jgi:hypothetical protein
MLKSYFMDEETKVQRGLSCLNPTKIIVRVGHYARTSCSPDWPFLHPPKYKEYSF